MLYAYQFLDFGDVMGQAKTISAKELKRVLDLISACDRHAERNRTMLLFTHLCGMRVGEVCALKISDVLDEHDKVRSELRLAPTQTKGSRGRTVFVPKKMLKELTAYISTIDIADRNAPLFKSQKGAAFSSNSATQLFQRLYERAGLIGATSHSGRRTFITSLAQKGVGVRVLASLAGHRNISITQRYIDVNDDMLRDAVDLI